MQKLLLIILLFLLISNDVPAQNKIAVVNTDSIYSKIDKAENLDSIIRQYQDSLYKKVTEREENYNKKMAEWRSCDDCPKLTDAEKEERLKYVVQEINAIQNANNTIQALAISKVEEIKRSLRKRIVDMATVIGKENNYTYVFDISDEHLYFFPLPHYDDITNLLLSKLGL